MAKQTQRSKNTTTEKQVIVKKAASKGSAEKHPEEQDIVPDVRNRLIAEAAYLIAEQRGFQGGRELEDWLQAEAEVDARFSARH